MEEPTWQRRPALPPFHPPRSEDLVLYSVEQLHDPGLPTCLTFCYLRKISVLTPMQGFSVAAENAPSDTLSMGESPQHSTDSPCWDCKRIKDNRGKGKIWSREDAIYKWVKKTELPVYIGMIPTGAPGITSGHWPLNKMGFPLQTCRYLGFPSFGNFFWSWPLFGSHQ